jgi:hypothetical protein
MDHPPKKPAPWETANIPVRTTEIKATKNAPDRPWRSYMTLDMFNNVLWASLLHPFVAWVMGPLSLRALHTPWDHWKMRLAIGYSVAMTLIWMLNIVNKRIAWGLPRDVDFEEEVIVITGGASGLGQLIAEVYGMRGANVAVLDIQEVPRAGDKGIQYYKCDVGDREQVERVAEQIKKDVSVVDRLDVHALTQRPARHAHNINQQCWRCSRKVHTGPISRRN